MSGDTKAVDVLERIANCGSHMDDVYAAVAELIEAGQMVERDLAWARTEHTTALNALSGALALVQGDAA